MRKINVKQMEIKHKIQNFKTMYIYIYIYIYTGLFHCILPMKRSVLTFIWFTYGTWQIVGRKDTAVTEFLRFCSVVPVESVLETY